MAADNIEVRSEGGRFAMVPRWVHRSGLSDGAVRLYIALADRADYDTHSARFSRRVLAADIGVTEVKTVTRRLKELVDFGAVMIEHIFSEEHGNEISRYVLAHLDPRVTNDPGGGHERPRPRSRTTPARVGDDPSPRVTNDPASKKNLELRENSSSSGPVHQEFCTGRDEDDEAEHQEPPPADALTGDAAVAQAVAGELGRRDSARAPNRRIAAPHAAACAAKRWATERWHLTALVRANPAATVIELADLAEISQLVTSGAPPGPPPRARPRTANCPTCYGHSSHMSGSCPFADEPLTAEELAAIEAEIRGGP